MVGSHTRSLAPVNLSLGLKKAQGLKPRICWAFTARLKSCPDTKRSGVDLRFSGPSRGDVFRQSEAEWICSFPFGLNQFPQRIEFGVRSNVVYCGQEINPELPAGNQYSVVTCFRTGSI
jgi:hypothetical protein